MTTIHTITHRNQRSENQDTYAWATFTADGKTGILALIADGMGGVANGAQASQSAAHIYMEAVKAGDITDDTLIEAVATAHQQVASTRGGTTLTLLRLYDGQYWILQIGDSRAYKIPAGTLEGTQLTEDHSALNDFKRRGVTITPDIAGRYASRITRALGHPKADGHTPDTYAGTYQPGDMFLLCSDGFWHAYEAVGNKLDALTEAGLNDLATRAQAAGEQDNITALLASTEGLA